MDGRWSVDPFGNDDALALLGWLADLGPFRSVILLGRVLRRLAGSAPGEDLDFWTVAEGVAAAALVSALAGGPRPEHPAAALWTCGPAPSAGQVRDLLPHARAALARACDGSPNNEWAQFWQHRDLMAQQCRALAPWREHLASVSAAR